MPFGSSMASRSSGVRDSNRTVKSSLAYIGINITIQSAIEHSELIKYLNSFRNPSLSFLSDILR